MYNLRERLQDAVAEMAGWEGPSLSGVNGKDVTFEGFQFVYSDCYVRGMATKNSLEQYFDRKGFNVSRFSFFNAEMTGLDIALDENLSFPGFNNWGHCAFVPSGYIMPYFLLRCEYISNPSPP